MVSTDFSVFVLSRVSSTSVRVFLVLRDVLEVMRDVGLQSTRAGEEPSHHDEHLPAVGTVGSVETRHNSQKIILVRRLGATSDLAPLRFCFGSGAFPAVTLAFMLIRDVTKPNSEVERQNKDLRDALQNLM